MRNITEMHWTNFSKVAWSAFHFIKVYSKQKLSIQSSVIEEDMFNVLHGFESTKWIIQLDKKDSCIEDILWSNLLPIKREMKYNLCHTLLGKAVKNVAKPINTHVLILQLKREKIGTGRYCRNTREKPDVIRELFTGKKKHTFLGKQRHGNEKVEEYAWWNSTKKALDAENQRRTVVHCVREMQKAESTK